ncbi:hypothetical protein F4083_02595 [Candidatus Poribacteria bacterium]|nr:hypothetical protein [Candidatus Poribacteria bacterium]MYF55277.1 hypothetical protein [Candidatus Poribacteria bacterium]MYI93200.1 hypothetical protein [Candidatus Poribacteria bacterium]
MDLLKCMFFTTRSAVFILLTCQLFIFSSCSEYEQWTNDPPEINTFTIPTEVRYGETVELKIGVTDPENDDLTYIWEVSTGTLIVDEGARVQWTAPELTDSEIAPDEKVTVHVTVRDKGEESVIESATIIVYSKAFRVAKALSGTYELVRAQVDGETTEAFGSMRLTTSTFSRDYQGDGSFFYGSYRLIEPFDESKGIIYWLSDGNTQPTVSNYTWDGELLVLYWTATATGHVYQKLK